MDGLGDLVRTTTPEIARLEIDFREAESKADDLEKRNKSSIAAADKSLKLLTHMKELSGMISQIDNIPYELEALRDELNNLQNRYAYLVPWFAGLDSWNLFCRIRVHLNIVIEKRKKCKTLERLTEEMEDARKRYQAAAGRKKIFEEYGEPLRLGN